MCYQNNVENKQSVGLHEPLPIPNCIYRHRFHCGGGPILQLWDFYIVLEGLQGVGSGKGVLGVAAEHYE